VDNFAFPYKTIMWRQSLRRISTSLRDATSKLTPQDMAAGAVKGQKPVDHTSIWAFSEAAREREEDVKHEHPQTLATNLHSSKTATPAEDCHVPDYSK
jgi:hypothetical protein